MANKAEIIIKLGASGQRQVVSGIGGVTRGVGDLRSQVFNLRNLLAGLGLGLLVRDLTHAAGEQRRAVMGMETAMRSMGRYSPELSAKLQDVASSLQDVTNYGDEATLQGQKFLLTYRDITDDLLPRSSEVMQDLAALMGGDVTAAANMLGKASMGMTGELRRVGITVDSETFKLKGYAGVLAEIESQVKGQARAMREASGPWTALGNAIGDVKEEAGDIVNAVFAPVGDELIAWVGGIKQAAADFKESAGFREWADQAAGDIIGGFERALIGSAEIVDEFGPVVSGLWDSVEHMWVGFRALPPWVQEVGIVGALIGGTKGKALLALTAMSAGIIERQAKAAEAYGQGLISLKEWANSNDKELEALLATRRLQLADMPSHGTGLLPQQTGPDLMPSHGDAAAAMLGLGSAEDSAVDYVTRFLQAAHAKADELLAARQGAGESGLVGGGGAGAEGGNSFTPASGAFSSFGLGAQGEGDGGSAFSLSGEGPLTLADQMKLDSAVELDLQLADIRTAQMEATQQLADFEIAEGERSAQARIAMWKNAGNAGMGVLQMLQSGSLQQSRKGFEVAKAAAIGETVINTYKAATGAYSALAMIPYVGPALGAAAAAAAIAAGMANVSAIKNQRFGGGGVGATSYGNPGTPTNPIVTADQLPAQKTQREQQPAKVYDIKFYGYTNAQNPDELARTLIDSLRKAEGDNY